MNFYEHFEKLQTLKYLAEHKRCGTPQYLADKLQVSERTLLRMVHELREHGYPIFYNRFRATYEVKD